MRKYTAINIDLAISYYNRLHPEKSITKRKVAQNCIKGDLSDNTKFNYMTLYSKGDRNCPASVLISLSEMLKCTVDFLLGKTSKPN